MPNMPCANLVGKLVVKLDQIEVNEDHPLLRQGISVGAYIRLAVSDSGKGMAPNIQKRIFDPVFTTKGVGEGDWIRTLGYSWGGHKPRRNYSSRKSRGRKYDFFYLSSLFDINAECRAITFRYPCLKLWGMGGSCLSMMKFPLPGGGKICWKH